MSTRRLYKYRAFNSFTEQIICENKLYFANAEELNDPHDCKPVMTFTGIEEDYIEYLNDCRRRNGLPALSQAQQAEVRQNCQGLHDALEIANKEVVRNCGICSMSELNNSTMMFSHYAASHSGLCLEFCIPEDNDIGELRPVAYMDAFPEIHQRDLPNAFDPQTNDSVIEACAEKFFSQTYFSKASPWAYEREWRWFRRSSGLVEFPANVLTGVILGCRMSQDDEKAVIKMLEERTPDVMVCKATESRADYELEITPL